MQSLPSPRIPRHLSQLYRLSREYHIVQNLSDIITQVHSESVGNMAVRLIRVPHACLTHLMQQCYAIMHETLPLFGFFFFWLLFLSPIPLGHFPATLQRLFPQVRLNRQ